MPSLAGSFLVARPALEDSNFRQAVVLLLQHGTEGAFGLVVNRAASVKGLPFLVYAGGPCESEGFLMLHGHPDWLDSSPDPGRSEVAPGIYLGDASCLNRITEAGSQDALNYRMFAGYAGWGAFQLESELTTGAWAVTPASGKLLFDTPIEDLW